MENIYTIYAHINKINKKIYIGQTKQNLARRFRTNGERYKHSSRFYADIQKYGWNNFEHLILFENLSLAKANEIEIFLIQKYNTTNPEYGYNEAIGGKGFTSFSSELISQKNKERWAQGIYDNIKNAVYCIELNHNFESALQAERETGIDNSTIQKVCKGLLKYCGFSPLGQPLHWIFVTDKTDDKIQKLKNKKEILKGISIPVYCPELQQIFKSTQEASTLYAIDASSIRKVIRGVQKTAGRHPETKVPLHWIERTDLIQSQNKLSQETWDALYMEN